MIDLRGYEVLDQHVCTLEATSEDEEHHCFMVHNTVPVVNMDSVAKSYVSDLAANQKLKRIDRPPTVDALFIDSEGKGTLVEFKNGKISYRQIRDKVSHTLLILSDIASFDIGASRTEIDFVLVYNEDAYPAEEHDSDTGNERYDSSHRVQPSKSRADLVNSINNRAKKRRSFRALKDNTEIKLRGYCCRSVEVLTAQQFLDRFVALTSSFYGSA